MQYEEMRLKCLELAKGDIAAAMRMYDWVSGRTDACKQAANPQIPQAVRAGVSGLAGGFGSCLPGA